MQLVDYLNGMWYMICLPSLLCGLAISVEDIRSRRIPRAWIATGCTVQIIVNLIYALSINTLYLALQAILFAVLSAVLQCALALVKPGSLGFGDVTATLLMGLAVGMFGLVLWTRFDPQKHTAYAGKTPFAPALVAAGAIGIAIGVLF